MTVLDSDSSSGKTEMKAMTLVPNAECRLTNDKGRTRIDFAAPLTVKFIRFTGSECSP